MHIQQTSKEVGESKWKWSLWLEGSDEDLDRVQRVVYHLHPTFPDPVVERSTREDKFRLDASGWGTFVVKADVHMNDGSTESLRHRLRFARSEPRVFVSAASSEKHEVDAVKAVLNDMQIDATSAEDVPPGEDLSSTIRERIDQAMALVLINGSTPSRWVMQEIETAKSLGKPIVSIGQNEFYDTTDARQISSIGDLQGALGKLPG